MVFWLALNGSRRRLGDFCFVAASSLVGEKQKKPKKKMVQHTSPPPKLVATGIVAADGKGGFSLVWVRANEAFPSLLQ